MRSLELALDLIRYGASSSSTPSDDELYIMSEGTTKADITPYIREQTEERCAEWAEAKLYQPGLKCTNGRDCGGIGSMSTGATVWSTVGSGYNIVRIPWGKGLSSTNPFFEGSFPASVTAYCACEQWSTEGVRNANDESLGDSACGPVAGSDFGNFGGPMKMYGPVTLSAGTTYRFYCSNSEKGTGLIFGGQSGRGGNLFDAFFVHFFWAWRKWRSRRRRRRRAGSKNEPVREQSKE